MTVNIEMIDSVPYFIARISEDSDFLRLREMAENHDGWSLDYSKPSVKVWTKQFDDSSFNMVKVWAVFSDINCVDLYDTIHDPEYRKEWDTHMIVGINIGYLNPNNDISYYAMYCPTPLKNRDLVLQKSWLDNGTEFYIINHSVYHKDYPPKKGFVRAISYFTGYFIKCKTLNRDSYGCEFSYVTRSDPQGVLPSWLVNKCTQILAPRYVKQIETAASKYGNWKSNNNPFLKPWVYPEQIQTPRVSIRDCVPCEAEMELRPALRICNFELYYSPTTLEESSEMAKVNNNVQKHSKLLNPTCSHTADSLQESEERHSKSSSVSSEGQRKSSKSRLNSLLNFIKICRRKQSE